MAVKYSSIQTDICDIKDKVFIGADSLDFGFYINRYTPLLESEIRAKRELAKTAGDTLIAQILPTLAWIDMLDDKGDRMPPTLETLQLLPLNSLFDMVNAMDVAMTPGKKSSAPSEGSFVATQ